ncbi:MAG: hypothetical protein UV74_C0013G0178 [Candidatus Woesebacteria bacterium GW2011_GWB1_43_14]|uniref:Uncharacterized protein n=1 Tax=Candidatus Woesebacteria bacterium GW2011_GWB1_43_14 TaxID=1618578 RepID=A0A0G1FPU8_9BACT|nr:MAG: hypothetical protein UV51_C0005G0042 [Candidatus Woesebacteria bacterium GW2011_GWC1_42_9]KKS97056.1 MAG: hypothetical protein UV74_C0013G0178 [Candidatus Woesebacteria bacterium GW2011_GWB1_43_14]
MVQVVLCVNCPVNKTVRFVVLPQGHDESVKGKVRLVAVVNKGRVIYRSKQFEHDSGLDSILHQLKENTLFARA